MDQQQNEANREKRTLIALGSVGSLCFGAFAVARIIEIEKDRGLDGTTLIAIAAAVGFAVLPFVDSISFGDWKVNFRRLERQIANTKVESSQALEISKAADDAARARMAPPEELSEKQQQLSAAAVEFRPGSAPNDSWNGVFGGQPHANDRNLYARVSKIIGDPGWFLIHLVVESLNRANPLDGEVRFFLHSTFPNPQRTVPVIDGRAQLRLRAWGAFTVGALADEGRTRLELDLAANPSFPEEFRKR